MTSNKKPAPHLKEEFFTQHLPYEIDMLRATYELARVPKPPAEHDALAESFLMHARNHSRKPCCATSDHRRSRLNLRAVYSR